MLSCQLLVDIQAVKTLFSKMNSKFSLKKVFRLFNLGGCKGNTSVHHKAAKCSCLKNVKKIIEKGGCQNKMHEDIKKKTKLTPLELAVIGDNIKIVECLINSTSDVDYESLLNLAWKDGNMEILEFLNSKMKSQTEVEKEVEIPNGRCLRTELLEAFEKIEKLSYEVMVQELEKRRLKSDAVLLKNDAVLLKNNAADIRAGIYELKKLTVEAEKTFLQLKLN